MPTIATLAPRATTSSATIVDHGTLIFALTLASFILATFFVAARMISKLCIVRRPGWEDAMVGFAWCQAAVLSVGLIWSSRHGAGVVFGAVDSSWVAGLHTNVYLFQVIYPLVTACTRSSVLLLYIRLSVAYPWLGKASYCLLALTIVTGLVTSLLGIFQCHSLGATFRAWLVDPDINNNGLSCTNMVTVHLCVAPVQFLLNVAVVLLPLPIITEIRMEKRQKRILLSTLTLGSAVCIVTISRIVFLQATTLIGYAETIGESDPATDSLRYNMNIAWLLSLLEVNIGLVCACILVLKPLMLWLFPGILDDSRQTASNGGTEASLMHLPRLSSSGSGRSMKNEKAHIPEVKVDEADTGAELELSDFLNMDRSDTFLASPAMSPVRRESAFDGFVTMQASRSLSELSGKQARWQMAAIATVFFMYNFSGGMMTMLTSLVNNPDYLTPVQSIALNGIFWTTGLAGCPVLGYFVLARNPGFKGTLMVGLWLSAAATLGYWPSSVLLSYTGCIVSTVLLSMASIYMGLAANTLTALIGSENLMEARLNLLQGVGYTGHLLATLLVSRVFSSADGTTGQDLAQSQWCYLIYGMLCIVLSVGLFYARLSEASSEDMETRARQRFENGPPHRDQTTWGIRTLHLVVAGALLAQFCLFGARQTMAQFRDRIVLSYAPSTNACTLFGFAYLDNTMTICGRLCGAGICYFGVPGRILLLSSCLLCSAFAALVAFTSSAVPSSAHTSFFLLYMLFQGPIAPTLWALTLRGSGRHAKVISIILTMGFSGAGVWPAVTWSLQQHGVSAPIAVAPVVGLCAVPAILLAIASVTPSLRLWMDPSPAGKLPVNAMTDSEDMLGAETAFQEKTQIEGVDASTLFRPPFVDPPSSSTISEEVKVASWEDLQLPEVEIFDEKATLTRTL